MKKYSIFCALILFCGTSVFSLPFALVDQFLGIKDDKIAIRSVAFAGENENSYTADIYYKYRKFIDETETVSLHAERITVSGDTITHEYYYKDDPKALEDFNEGIVPVRPSFEPADSIVKKYRLEKFIEEKKQLDVKTFGDAQIIDAYMYKTIVILLVKRVRDNGWQYETLLSFDSMWDK